MGEWKMTPTDDPPYYQPAKAGRRVHICRMKDHTLYWLNVPERLWVCERCHPPTVDCPQGGLPRAYALARVWEIVEGGQGLGAGGQQDAAGEAV